MPPAARLNDMAFNPADAHGCNGCPHAVTGPAIGGSPTVMINQLSALRIGDPGVHAACCGPNSWAVALGSGTVTINDIPAARLGDMTAHCGGVGSLIVGSHNVSIGG